MKHRAILGDVDLLPGEHAFGPALDVCLAGQIAQEAHRFVGHAILRIVEEHVPESKREPLEPTGVRREQVAHVDGLHFGVVAKQRLPGGGQVLQLHKIGD